MKKFRTALKYRGTECLNCGHSLDRSEKYCSNCGQLNSTKKLAFDDFFNEFFAGVFAYDSRVRRTFKALMFSPGKVSRDYIQGKRMRYANPFRFYLSASILFFLIWSLTSGFDGFDTGNQAREVKELSPEEIGELRGNLQKVPALNDSPLNVDTLLARQQRQGTESYRDKYYTGEELDSMGFFNSISSKLILYDAFYKETEIIRPGVAMDSLGHVPTAYNRWLYNKATDFNDFKKNPEVFLNYFINKLPFIIFFFLPLFALFIWLLYIRRPFNYMEHLIFTFHVQTTFFIIIGISLIFDYILDTDMVSGLMLAAFLFYLYKAMRRFYLQGGFKTIVKFILLNFIFLILAFVAAIFSFIASFAIY
ncbi:DUF3667 domain-containing protein [Antarcticibacterium flavum]|uniref:DUF3667 domain-containing protein n=1 Tax=Antarcticibacterium flavum TaxID=2058175 RepID=A0A5B7X6I6_9FLAO|nr:MULTISPECIES: DUF3667 domain-containing protein [Antarcticibacterium]MCM4160062.1 hypothetical protein [Antarcticibacterium sp. W02-3]QCY70352.1 DUF3667 domain-containing protein [Antarcticibacterium flavum]